MKPVRVGVIGVGYLGQHHARLYAELPGVVLAGVTDTNPDRARAIGERYRARVFPDTDSLLKHVDAVSIAVPTAAHYPVAKTCLAAGVHVLVEKPITATVAEAYDLVELARQARRILQVGHVERFNPAIRAVQPYIKQPGFIECHRLSPFMERGTDVDVVLDLMIHDLDIVLSFDPGPVEEVHAAGVAVLSSNIDIANARISFQSGCVANLTASRVSTTRMRKLRLFQRDLYLSVDYQTRQGVICRRHAGPDGRPQIETEPIRGGDAEPLRLQLEAFARAAATGERPLVSGEHGAAALELAHRVLRAIAEFLSRHGERRAP
jgi:predicted dehydrogenase